MRANFLDHVKEIDNGRIPGMTSEDEVLLTVLVGLLRRIEHFDEIAMFGPQSSRKAARSHTPLISFRSPGGFRQTFQTRRNSPSSFSAFSPRSAISRICSSVV